MCDVADTVFFPSSGTLYLSNFSCEKNCKSWKINATFRVPWKIIALSRVQCSDPVVNRALSLAVWQLKMNFIIAHKTPTDIKSETHKTRCRFHQMLGACWHVEWWDVVRTVLFERTLAPAQRFARTFGNMWKSQGWRDHATYCGHCCFWKCTGLRTCWRPKWKLREIPTGSGFGSWSRMWRRCTMTW